MPPIAFAPIYKTRVWGGRRFEALMDRELPDGQPYGESWELCDREEAQSEVLDGPFAGRTLHDLWTRQRAEVFGRRYANHPAERFPILLKVLDCEDTLSLQVHPPAERAGELRGEPKTEMWYVAHAEPHAAIYAGLKAGAARPAFEHALSAGSVADLVHQVVPEKGQFMFVPSGRLHALGAGLLVYEIQQNSDTTYRVFDWNRMGLDGQPRELHVAQSLKCIDFEDFEPPMQSAAPDGSLASCPWFDVRQQTLPHGGSATLARPEDFTVVAVTEGSLEVAGRTVAAGGFVLVPPADHARLASAVQSAAWLEIRLP